MRKRVVYVNGSFVDEDKAKVSVFDRGFLFADAVYEVTAVIDGKILEWDGHVKRLERSLKELDMKFPISETELLDIHFDLIKKNELKEGLIYLQVTRGVAERDFNFATNSLSPTVVIFTQEKLILSNPASKMGIKIITVPDDRWRRRDIKTTQLLAQSLAKTYAIQKGVDDSLLVQDGFINECSSSNVFIIKEKNITTPNLSNDILGGITRSSLIKFCKKNNIEIKEQKISVDDMMGAQEVFLTSSTGFVLPVIDIDGRQAGNGLVGDRVKEIQRIYIEQIKVNFS